MNRLKKFFDKKKKDVKFNKYGEGKSLSEPSSAKQSYQHQQTVGPRKPPSSGAQLAGQAAIARLESRGNKEVNWSLQAIRAQARREMEAERKMTEMTLEKEQKESATSQPVFDQNALLAVDGVYFTCPFIGPNVDKYEIIKENIKHFLRDQLNEDKAVASCLIIQTCNKNKEKVSSCIQKLSKYLENIISNPNEGKYKKIRFSNKVYMEHIQPIEGAKEFLEAAGFEVQTLPFNDITDQFWVYPLDRAADTETLQSLLDTLICAEPIKPQLDRTVQLMLPVYATKYCELPPEFFNMTADELKREQQLRSEIVERNEMLMTKAMREKVELREAKKYRFTLIRIRFPDGIILQGTFGVYEKVEEVYKFIRDHLVNEWRPFNLFLSGGGKINDEDQKLGLLDVRLVPKVMINFEWDSSVQDENLNDNVYLKDETLQLLNLTN